MLIWDLTEQYLVVNPSAVATLQYQAFTHFQLFRQLNKIGLLQEIFGGPIINHLQERWEPIDD